MPKLSIIIPVYNVEKFLHKCITSIINQKFKSFELILINDGSTDKSGEICEYYAKKDSRIKVIHKQNSGVSDARNAGIDIAKGTYISFVDSDDYVNEYMFEKLYDSTSHEQFDLIVSGIIFERKNNTEWQNKIMEYEAFDFRGFNFIIKELFLSYLLYNPVAKLYKKDIIERNNIRFRSDMSFGEDPVFNCEYIKYISSLKTIDKCYYNYVKHGEISLSNRYDSNKFNCNRIMYIELKELMNYYYLEDSEVFDKLEWRYKKELFDMIFTLFKANENVTFKDKYRFINIIFKDSKYEFLNDYLSNINIILKFILKIKSSALVLLYFTLAKQIKKGI